MKKYTLNIIDNRTGVEMKNQIKDFKKELLVFIEEQRDFDEDDILNFINENRINSPLKSEDHKSTIELIFDEPIEDNSTDIVEIMNKHSRLHPHITFEFIDEDLTFHSHRIIYFKAGKYQICEPRIITDPFDENKLI